MSVITNERHAITGWSSRADDRGGPAIRSKVRPRGDMDEHSDPAKEQVDVDRAELGGGDDPTPDREGGPEDRRARSEEQRAAVQFAGPECMAAGCVRESERAHHGPSTHVARVDKTLSGNRGSA